MGLSRKATEQEKTKKAREERIKERKSRTDLSRATNAEIFEYLNDIADQQSEIYNLLKERQ